MTSIEERFEELYRAFRRRVDEPGPAQVSSLTVTYTSAPEYGEIVALGDEALPAVLDKLRGGDFFLNEAALEIAGLRRDDVAQQPGGMYSEQELSRWILARLRPDDALPPPATI